MKSNKVWKEISNGGPKTRKELSSQLNPEIKRDGIRVFRPSANGKGTTKSGGGKNLGVYYIEGKHDEKAIVEKWLDVNKRVVKAVGKWAIHQRIASYGDEFTKASYELLGPFNPGNPGKSGGATDIEECSLCHSTDFKSLADHLLKCPER